MGMADEHLSDELKAAGAAMTRELDQIGLYPQGCLWAFRHDLRDWRFCVISDLVPALGRRKVYDLLGIALDAVGTSDALTIFDVHLYEHSEGFARLFNGLIRVNGISSVELTDCVFNGEPVDAFVYRLLPAREREDIARSTKAFEKKVRALTT
jgi:hypothetical protein